MANYIFRILISFNATSLMFIIFFVKCDLSIAPFFKGYDLDSSIVEQFSYFLYVSIPFIFTSLSLFISKFLGKDEFKIGEVEYIDHANNDFLPSYLGYFFVALSVSDWDVFLFVYIVVFVFTFLSRSVYFNPIFLVFGYEFYRVQTRSGVNIFLISRKRYKVPGEVQVDCAFRINDYTFIERG